MKRPLIALAIALTLLTLALTPDSNAYVDPLIESEFMHGSEYGSPSNREYELLISAQASRIQELEIENNALQTELVSANELASQVTDYDSLTAQVASMQKQLGSMRSSLSAGYTELNKLRSAATSIKAAIAKVTPEMGTVGCRTFPRSGNHHSMEPTFSDFDLVCITQDAAYLLTVDVGDIVIAPKCSGYDSVIHRVISDKGDRWQLKGDNNGVPDVCEPLKSSVTWKVVAIAKGAYL